MWRAGALRVLRSAEQSKGSFLTDSSPMEPSQTFLLHGIAPGRCLPEQKGKLKRKKKVSEKKKKVWREKQPHQPK